MTMDPDLDPLDELASAYLDDEVTPAQRAEVEADPELLARVARLAPVAAALREPVEIDATERDAALTAALAAFTPQTAEPVAPGGTTASASARPTGSTDDLAGARRRREHRAERSRRIGAWLGAAAAAGAIGVVATGGFGGSDMEAASTADTVAAAVAAADAPAETLGAIDGGADVATAEESVSAAAEFESAETTAAAAEADAAFSQVALAFTTEAELVDYVDSFVAARTSAANLPATSMAPPCGLPAGLSGDSVGSAAWQGAPGELFLVPSALAPTAAVILSADCSSVLVRVDL